MSANRKLTVTRAIQAQALIHGYHLTDEEASDIAGNVMMVDAETSVDHERMKAAWDVVVAQMRTLSAEEMARIVTSVSIMFAIDVEVVRRLKGSSS